jgi:hypothetical protein
MDIARGRDGSYCAAAPGRGAARTVSLLLALLGLANVAVAQEPVGQTRVLNLAPVAFAPSNNDSRYVIREGGLGVLCVLKGGGYFTAALRLEQGAVIERIGAFVEDKDTTSFALMSLARRTAAKSELLAITPVSSGAHAVETLSADQITTPVVDNETHSYLLQVMLSGPGVCLRGAEVRYRLPP